MFNTTMVDKTLDIEKVWTTTMWTYNSNKHNVKLNSNYIKSLLLDSNAIFAYGKKWVLLIMIIISCDNGLGPVFHWILYFAYCVINKINYINSVNFNLIYALPCVWIKFLRLLIISSPLLISSVMAWISLYFKRTSISNWVLITWRHLRYKSNK